MSGLDNILDPNERVLWRGAPDKKKFSLSVLWVIPIALVFLGIASIYLIMGIPFVAFITVPLAIAFILVPIISRSRKVPHIEYMITNQRLLIKSGIAEEDVWFAKLDEIKDVIAKKGKLYPITANFPYEPKGSKIMYGEDYDSISVYNIVANNYESMTRIEFYRIDQSRPRLEALPEPSVVEKLIREAILETRKNIVSCKYCHALLDLDKERKCPKCGRSQQ